ncbi:ImmA/IrrE family metallo-endopeptidase [Staphylococcus sp. 18_1_E_LY]|uniref:ImmA/IrrE family metallo-endopeptidase n=1 Tax=Staphylococcus lloydii TaxID=2781774 RepID=A0A7T1AZL9_9STAP|nr:ImmA/IrrE family metallo-endopeptidase [Staphylococcus lloydii]MBF7019653.1 ImmA/IrrE family metallo-endopeptidase [Staphylococcus lloydii]MBF7027381.1 ImmA/IrrE family metallo-endopeptidase [Staphylococcus lloydii]QPM75043.1 ImmA/IrrE family metallo-endopeptidase [Staphylococcus lloydii]
MNYEESQSFMFAVENAHQLISDVGFPVEINSLIKADPYVELFTFGEFARMTNIKRCEVFEIGQTDEAFHFKKGDKSVIVYNALKNIKRQRFTLAHEYGHIKLNHTGKSIYESATNTVSYSREEYEADVFASGLLFPLHKRYEYKGKSSYEIANKFNISFSAVKVSMRILERHIELGLETYLTKYRHRKSDSYINFLREFSS